MFKIKATNRYLFSVTIFLYSIYGNSQSYQQEIDSLKHIISYDNDSISLASLYNELGFAYRRFSVDSLEHYTDLAIQTAELTGDIGNLAKGYKNKGIAYYKNGSNYKKAIDAYEIGLKYAQEANDYNTQVGCLNNIGVVYYTIFQFQSSLKYYYQALEIYNERIDKNEFIKGLMLGNIGMSYREIKEHEKELEFIRGVIEYAETYDHKRLFVIYCDDYVKSLHKKGETKRAISLCDECIEESNKISDYHSKTQALLTLAEIRYDLKEYNRSLEIARQCELLAKEKNLDIVSSQSYLVQAKSLRMMGDLNNAVEIAKIAYKTGNDQHKFWQSSQAALLLSELYSEQHDYKEAYQYQEEYNKLSRANNDLLAKAQTEEIEAQYQVDNYLKTIEALNKQNDLQSTVSQLYIATITFMSLGLIFTFLFYRKSKRAAQSLFKLNEENKQTQKALQEKHDELETIFRNSHEGIIYKELESGKIITCNQMALDIHNAQQASDITNLMPLASYPDDTVNGMAKADYVALKRERFHQEGKLNTTWKFKNPAGEIRHFEINAITDPLNEQNTKIVAFYRDITEEKKAKESLEHRNAELEKYIESNIQLEQFAHVASHDLRAPLITINSFSKLLHAKAGSKLDEKESQYLEFISSNGIQMFDLVNDLLEYSKINSQKIHISEVCVGMLATTAANTLLKQAEERAVSIDIKGNMPLIQADEIKLKRVFQNLLSNAIKFSDDNKDSYIHISSTEDSNAYKFIIEDNGIGMRDHDVNIFLPYTQLNKKSDYKGTGMGLSFCQKIIDQHKGKIDYTSKLNKGTTFYFTISKNINT